MTDLVYLRQLARAQDLENTPEVEACLLAAADEIERRRGGTTFVCAIPTGARFLEVTAEHVVVITADGDRLEIARQDVAPQAPKA